MQTACANSGHNGLRVEWHEPPWASESGPALMEPQEPLAREERKDGIMNGLRAAMACVVVGLCLGLGGVAHALPVQNGLVGWYDASDVDANPSTANQADGTLSTWVNKANPGTNNGAGTGTVPTLRSTAGDQMNGWPVVRFPSTNSSGYDLGTFRSTDGPYHYFGVTKASSSQLGVGWQRLVSSYDSLTSGNDWTGSSWCVGRPLANWATNGAPNAYPPPYSGFVAQQSEASKKMKVMRLGRNAQSGGDLLNADMSEVLLYTRQLNSAERIITENYLMARYYGTNAQTASTTQTPTPSVLPPANDVYSGDDAGKGNYDFDVCGVGQVNASNQLLRTNDPSIISPTAWYNFNAGLILEATGGLDDGEWLLAGHKVLANSWVAADLPIATDQRWDRVWYLDYTGTLDARVTFDFSEGGLSYSPPPGKVFDLIYSATNAFAFERLALAGTTTGDQVSFLVPGGVRGDGYYTLALGDAIPEPASLTLLAAAIGSLALRRRAKGVR